MAGIAVKRCASPEQMPHLEPLTGAPDYEVNSLHDPSPAPLAPPLSGSLHESPTQEPCRDISCAIRNIIASLKLGFVLENKGNVARDHLASERTYLAYVRTSLACASAGVALVQLFTMNVTNNASTQQTEGADLSKIARPLGASIILLGLSILVFGLVRYFTTQSALVHGHFPVARNSITTLAFVLGSLVGIIFGLIVAGT